MWTRIQELYCMVLVSSLDFYRLAIILDKFLKEWETERERVWERNDGVKVKVKLVLEDRCKNWWAYFRTNTKICFTNEEQRQVFIARARKNSNNKCLRCRFGIKSKTITFLFRIYFANSFSLFLSFLSFDECTTQNAKRVWCCSPFKIQTLQPL